MEGCDDCGIDGTSLYGVMLCPPCLDKFKTKDKVMKAKDYLTIVIDIEPMGKPRMTKRDKWKERPCVMRYRAWSDELRLKAGTVPDGAYGLDWCVFIEMPKSWSKKKKEEMRGKEHQVKPDRDNIDKAILDCLFKDDERDDCIIAVGELEKFWDDGAGTRLELSWRT